MTITLSIEELRAHEAALARWWRDRASALEQARIAQPVYHSHDWGRDPLGNNREEDLSQIKPALKKWDEEHPQPLLIPSL